MATIGDNVIEQLLLDGRAVRTGDSITLAARAARP